MPLILVTGLPGHAKTLYTIDRWMQEAAKDKRPVFQSGIKGCRVPGWQPFDVKEWELLPPNSIGIIDEAQFAFPVTGRGQTPEWVQKLATHRHLGIDLVLITQDPMLLDSFPRRLIDRHFHVVRTFGLQRATIYECPNGRKDDIGQRRSSDLIRHEYSYNKEVYKLYDSAEVHTVKARVPARVYMLIVLPILFFALVYVGYQRMKPESRLAQTREAAGLVESPARPAANPPGRDSGAAGGYGRSERMTAAEYVAAATPRIEGLAHTAPMFDAVTQPKEAPYPAACIASRKRCQCYSQQGTRLDMRDALCRQIADGGFFLAWNVAGERVQQPPQASQAPSQQPRQGQGTGLGSINAPSPQFAAQEVDPDAGSLPRRVRRAIN